jgi:transcription elongation factor GreA
MSLEPSTADLLRSVGLDIDGPARWGTKPTTRAAGIFAIEAESATRSAQFDIVEVRRWLERSPQLLIDGERPTDSGLAERIGSFWVPGQTLLYVGRTTKSLSSRVAALYGTELGNRRPHSGGHWLKTVRNQNKLRLWWAETDAPEEYEDALLAAFVESIPAEVRKKLPDGGPTLPWANLASPSGDLRVTGITGSLLDNDLDSSASSIRRSDGSGGTKKRKATSTSAAPKSPRRTKAKVTPASKREQTTPVTAEGFEGMKAEMVQLTTVERPQVVERVKDARELGDLRENADYEAARNEQSFLEGHILELEQKIRTAVIIENRVGSAISMGSTVRYEVEGTAGQMTIVGSTESDPSAGRISAVSPVGKALLGHRVDDDVVVRTPAAEIHYRIVAID